MADIGNSFPAGFLTGNYTPDTYIGRLLEMPLDGTITKLWVRMLSVSGTIDLRGAIFSVNGSVQVDAKLIDDINVAAVTTTEAWYSVTLGAGYHLNQGDKFFAVARPSNDYQFRVDAGGSATEFFQRWAVAYPAYEDPDTNSGSYYSGTEIAFIYVEYTPDSPSAGSKFFNSLFGGTYIGAPMLEYASGTAYTQNVNDTVTLAEAITSKDFTKNSSDTNVFSDSITGKEVAATKADVVNLLDIARKDTTTNKADTLALTDSVSKNPGKSLSDTITASDSLTKAITKVLGDSTTLVDTITRKEVSISKADTVSLAEAISKSLTKELSDSVTFSETVTLDKFLNLFISDSITFAESLLNKNISKAATDTVSLSDLASKSLSITRSDSITFSDSINIARFFELILSSTINFAEAITTKALGKALSDSIAIADSIQKGITKSYSENLTFTDSATTARSIFLSIADTINFSDQIVQKQFDKALADFITLSDIISKRTDLSLSDVISIADAVTPFLVSTFGKLMRYNGTTWVPANLFRRDGITYIPAKLFVYDGTQWREVNTDGI